MTITARPNQRDHILDVALRLMSEHGASKTSMRQLARECDLNVAAIYHYFDSKDALLAAVIAERQYGSRILDIPEIDHALPLSDRIATIFLTTWHGAIEEEAVWRLLLGEGLRGEPAAIAEGQSLLDIFRDGLEAWLRTAAPELEDPSEMAFLMMGQLFGGFVRRIFEPLTPSDEIAAASVQALLSIGDPGSSCTEGQDKRNPQQHGANR